MPSWWVTKLRLEPRWSGPRAQALCRYFVLLPCHPPSEGRRRRVLTEVIEQRRKSKWLGCPEATTTQRTTETLESSSLHRTLKTVETVATPVRRGVNWMTQSPANM